MLALRGSRHAPWALLVCIALEASHASAQTDVRQIRPDVMVLLDTSGSMEWRTDIQNSLCVGTDGGPCEVCSNGASICSPNCPIAEQQNRWAVALQTLTGTIPNFSCLEIPRTDNTFFTYDYLYSVPYHEPLSAGFPLWSANAGAQSPDGVMDTYAEIVRFGIMTFDNDPRIGVNINDGLFSYGPNASFLANGCTTASTPVNLGSRRASVDNNVTDKVPGGLISVGSANANNVTLDAINAQVQQSITGASFTAPTLPLFGTRPYGGTPIAAMLQDAFFYWTTNSDVTPLVGATGDLYYNCRGRYNILITDGQPNMDFRPACQGGTGICPYQTPDQTALQLAIPPAGGPGVKTFVIGFNATDPGAQTALLPIAINGGTNSVLYATDRATLQTALSNVLNSIAAQTTTRTAPAFGSSSSGQSNATLYQFQSSFSVATGLPWQGFLERRRTVCQGTPPAPVDQNIVPNQDEFGFLLQNTQRASNGWGQRKLWTWIPPSALTTADMQKSMAWSTGQQTRFNLDTTVNPALFAEPNGPARDTLFAWLRGDAGTNRANQPLGDIYHSNPLVWNAPLTSLPDQTFSAFRQITLPAGGWRAHSVTVGTRENMVYVGTNDGVLHAFNADTGEEAWGFVPPYLSGTVAAMYPANHQYGVDGTPVARELVYQRSGANLGNGNSWHSILLTGLRGGGGAYEALDVTDPYNPAFLWQFTDANMADAYGTPALTTVFTSWNAGAAQERAVAILPGGQGTPVATASCTAALGVRTAAATGDTRIAQTPPFGVPRGAVSCWQGTTGQYLYVVDVQTGALIAKFGPTGSPLVGSVAVYIGTPGAVSTRAYVGDSDGDMWRLDMSNPNPLNWRFGLLFDTFYNASQMSGEPIESAPVISQDTNGDTLIAVGSGDQDSLSGTDANRLAVYRENLTYDSSNAVSSIRVTNTWNLQTGPNNTIGDLFTGERLTGPMSLFNGILYFGTFVPQSTSDACQMGFSRLWAASLLSVVSGRPAPELNTTGDPANPNWVLVTQDINGDGNLTEDLNTVLFGVGIIRRPTCVTTASTADPYFGGSHQYVSGMSGGDFRLVVQTGRGGLSSGGSQTNVVSRVLPPPIVQTHLSAWASVFE